MLLWLLAAAFGAALVLGYLARDRATALRYGLLAVAVAFVVATAQQATLHGFDAIALALILLPVAGLFGVTAVWLGRAVHRVLHARRHLGHAI